MNESRIHLLNNGRSPAKKSGDLITRGQADEMIRQAVQLEREENERMVQWYMRQFPGLVAKMVGDALAANGLTLQPPEWTKLEPTAETTAVPDEPTAEAPE